MDETIDVRMGEAKVGDADDTIASKGLGSCIAVCLYDPDNHICGMAHVMLPANKNASSPKYANNLLDQLIDDMAAAGADTDNLVAKLFGGASLFDFSTHIGDENTESVRDLLRERGIDIVAEDVGGDEGRSVWMACDTGRVVVEHPFKDEKTY